MTWKFWAISSEHLFVVKFSISFRTKFHRGFISIPTTYLEISTANSVVLLFLQNDHMKKYYSDLLLLVSWTCSFRKKDRIYVYFVGNGIIYDFPDSRNVAECFLLGFKSFQLISIMTPNFSPYIFRMCKISILSRRKFSIVPILSGEFIWLPIGWRSQRVLFYQFVNGFLLSYFYVPIVAFRK